MNEKMPHTHSGRILVVDDTTANLQLLTNLLTGHGYTVHPASDGELALEFLGSILPDLILLDIRMPGMDGFEVCRRIKADERTRAVPIIFISILENEHDKVKGLQAGGVDYITKPFHPEEVLARIRTHLQLRDLTVRLEQTVVERTEELHAANTLLQHELAERKQMEAELLKYRDHLEEQVKERTDELVTAKNKAQQYLDIAGVILVAIDKNRKVTLINQKGCDVLGKTSGEIIGKDWFETFVPEKARQSSIKGFQGLMAGELQQMEFFENPVLARDGRELLISWHNVLLRDGQGHITGTLSSGEDITEQRCAEERIINLNQDLKGRAAALEAANKELEAFAYTVSHDLRAPLRHIDGFLELLQKEAGTAIDKQCRRYMDSIFDSVQKMRLLIDDLLSFSRIGRYKISFQRVETGALVRDVIRELELDVAGRVIDWHIGDLPEVMADAPMLRIVLDNLIANALKFTRQIQQARIEIGCLPGPAFETVVFIRDNGVGFDMAYADKLFGVFQRLHPEDEFEGTGIGLATVHRIIARHGGRTWAEAQVDRGAAFFFSLPKKPQEGNNARELPRPI
jgi:PAS domain S-box-containing protein